MKEIEETMDKSDYSGIGGVYKKDITSCIGKYTLTDLTESNELHCINHIVDLVNQYKCLCIKFTLKDDTFKVEAYQIKGDNQECVWYYLADNTTGLTLLEVLRIYQIFLCVLLEKGIKLWRHNPECSNSPIYEKDIPNLEAGTSEQIDVYISLAEHRSNNGN